MKRELVHLDTPSEKLFNLAKVAALISLGIPLAAGKWGSYIGFYNQGIFLQDVFFLSACLLAFMIKPRILLDNSVLLIAIWLFIAYQFMRNPDLGIATKLRDLVPFIYLGFFQPLSYLCSGISFRKLITLVRITTLFHLVWSSAIFFNLLKPLSLPFFFGLPIFTTRWDQTGFVIAIGFVAWSGYSKYQIKGSNVVRFGFLLLAFMQGSRAGLLAFAVALMWVFLHSTFWERELSFMGKDTFFKFLLILGMISLLLLPSMIKLLPENSALGRIGILQISESAKANADGTASGRSIAQDKLLAWVELRNESLLGVGPGVEMVYESGAFINLSGSKEVRSPHSWPVGALARFGKFGFCFWTLAIYLISRFRIVDVKHPGFSWIISVLLTAIFGVIIESPFGSLPLIFFLCCLRSYRKETL